MSCKQCNKKSKKSDVQVGESLSNVVNNRDPIFERPAAELPLMKRLPKLLENHNDPDGIIVELERIISEYKN